MRKLCIRLFLHSSWTPRLCVKTPYRPHFWTSLARAPFRASLSRAYDAQNAFRGRQFTRILTHSSCVVLRELQKFSSTTVLNSCFVANDHHLRHIPSASCLFFQTNICAPIQVPVKQFSNFSKSPFIRLEVILKNLPARTY